VRGGEVSRSPASPWVGGQAPGESRAATVVSLDARS
jgi:hypothetical protein